MGPPFRHTHHVNHCPNVCRLGNRLSADQHTRHERVAPLSFHVCRARVSCIYRLLPPHLILFSNIFTFSPFPSLGLCFVTSSLYPIFTNLLLPSNLRYVFKLNHTTPHSTFPFRFALYIHVVGCRWSPIDIWNTIFGRSSSIPQCIYCIFTFPPHIVLADNLLNASLVTRSIHK